MNTLTKGKNETTIVPPVSLQEYDIGEQMDMKARALGVALSDTLGNTINVIAKAKQDYEGGSFVVLFKLNEKLTDEQKAELPIPGSETGNNPAKYKKRVIGDRGKPSTKEFNYYNVQSDSLACNVAKQDRINKLELSLGDPSKVNMASVPQDIKDMAPDYVHAEISRLKGELATSRVAVNRAYELMFQIKAIKDLDGVDCYPIMKLNKDGTESSNEVENTKTPMVVTTTLDNRKAIDVKRLGIGSFMKLKPAVAKENGGTYAALIKTIERGTKSEDGDVAEDGNKPSLINTLDKLEARLTDVHDYLDVIWSDTKQEQWGALIQRLNRKEGSADFLVTITDIRNMFNDLLGKVHNAGPRYQDAINAAAKAADKAA